MTAKSCSTCRYWQDTSLDKTMGQCRINPPGKSFDPPFASGWPDTDAEDWCGQWAPNNHGRSITVIEEKT